MSIKDLSNIILDKLQDGIVIINQEKIIHYVNFSAVGILDKDMESLLNSEFEYPVLSHGYNEVAIFEGNSERNLKLSFQKINWESKPHTLIIIKDITENKLLEKELIKKSEIFQSFYDYSPLCMQSLNKEGVIVDVNPVWSDTLGYKKSEVIGTFFKDLLHNDDKNQFNVNYERFLQTGSQKNVYYRLKRKDRTYIGVEFNGSIGYNIEGEVEKTYCVFKDITKLKQVERELEHKIEILTEAESISRIGHWEFDMINNKFFWSDEVYKLFEIEKEKVQELNFDFFLHLIHPDDRSNIKKNYINSVEEKKEIILEYRIYTSAKKIKYIKQKFKTEYDKKGHPIKSFGIVADETELKSTLNAIRESEELYRELFESESDAIFLIENRTGNILKANRAAEKLYGYPLDELLKKKNTDLLVEPDKTKNFTLKSPVIKENVAFIPLRYHKNKKGEVFPVEITGRFFEWKNKKVHIAAIRDISVRIKTDEALKESQRMLSVLMSNLPGMAYRCNNDKNYTMLFVSDGCKELTGYEPEHLINNRLISYNDIVHSDSKSKTREDIQKAIKEKRPFQLEYKIITKEGKEKWVWEKGTGIESKDGKVKYLEGFISDISDLKRFEEELIKEKERAERSDQLKSSFLANMSHEIRTPMNGIVGFAKLLLKEDLDKNKKEKYVSVINNSSQQLLSIIGDILDISRIETGDVDLYNSEFSLTEMLETIYNSFTPIAESKKLDLVKNIQIPQNKDLIFADQTKLQQIITNLMNNGIKFTGKGLVGIECSFKKDLFTITVSDTGIGISKDRIHEVFDRFNKGEIDLTYQYSGTGLGLSISKAFVELMGGKIWLESEKGKGSEFYFTLPYKQAPKGNISTQLTKKDQKNAMKRAKVLIVEDELLNLEYLKGLLEEIGIYHIIHAENGELALELYNDHKNVDLILMDLKLPDISGFEVAKEIRKLNKNVPIIAQSVLTTLEDKVKASKSGCNDFISKPIDDKKLISIIKSYILNVEISC